MMPVWTGLTALAVAVAPSDPRIEVLLAGEEALAAEDPAMAAALYERGWLETQSVELLARAGLARAQLGHRAHAAVYLAEALARAEELGALRAEVEETLVAAQAATVPVAVTVTAEIGELRVHATRGGTTGAPRITTRVQVTALGSQTLVLHLDPTEWTIEVRAGGRELGSQRVSLSPGAQQVLVFGAGGEDRPARRSLVIGASSAGAGALVVGGLMAGISRSGLNMVFRRPNCAESRSLDACSGPAVTQTYRIGGGAFVLGAGAGALIAGLTGLTKQSTRRRALWIAEAAVGGGVFALGAGLLAVGTRRFNDANTGPYPWAQWQEGVGGASRLFAGGAGLLGAGLGLAAVSVAGLVLDAAQRRGPGLRALRVEGGALWF